MSDIHSNNPDDEADEGLFSEFESACTSVSHLFRNQTWRNFQVILFNLEFPVSFRMPPLTPRNFIVLDLKPRDALSKEDIRMAVFNLPRRFWLSSATTATRLMSMIWYLYCLSILWFQMIITSTFRRNSARQITRARVSKQSHYFNRSWLSMCFTVSWLFRLSIHPAPPAQQTFNVHPTWTTSFNINYIDTVSEPTLPWTLGLNRLPVPPTPTMVLVILHSSENVFRLSTKDCNARVTLPSFKYSLM